MVASSPRPFLLHDLVSEWEMSWQTVRRLATVAVEAAAPHEATGRLVRGGRGRQATLTWLPVLASRPGSAAQTTALAAALGPWRALGIDDVARVIDQHLGGAVGAAGARAPALADLLRRGFYYQPWMPRRVRDPEAFDEVLTALFYGNALFLENYASPSRAHDNVTVEPWSLVHALDGLYILGPVVGETELRLWALHRMTGARRCRDTAVSRPRDYHPEKLLGHGYGPFLSPAGHTCVRVPASEVAYALESPLPNQVGEPELLPDGSARVRLAVAPHAGVRFWARAVGAVVEEE